MKRVLLITDIFPPDIGGPATFIDRLAWSLTDHGVSVTVVCATPATDDSQDAARPFRVQRVPGRGKTGFGFRLRTTLIRQMLTHRHILVNGLEAHACAAARITGRRYVLKIVGDSVWEAARNSGQTQLSVDEFQSQDSDSYRDLRHERSGWMSRANAIITPSQYLANLVGGWSVEAPRPQVVLNGVTRDVGSAVTPTRRRSDDPLRLVFCGRLTNWKGVETILLTLSSLPRVQLDIIGDGPSAPMLHSLCNHLGLQDRIVWHGRLKASELDRAIAAAHVAVLMSSYEGLSHALLEAAHHGLPLIASNCGGNPEVIQDGQNGILIPYGDTARLREAIQTLHSNEDLRYRLAREAQRTAEHFDFDRTVSDTIHILQESHQ